MKRKILVTLLAFCLIASLCVVGAAADGPVAQIGDTPYDTLQAAVDAANDGDTVLLLNSITVDSSITVDKSNCKITLDLGGNTITKDSSSSAYGGGKVILLKGGELTVTNGTIKSDGYAAISGNGAISVEANYTPSDPDAVMATLILDHSAIVDSSSYAGIFVAGRVAQVDVYGSVKGEYYGVSGNGTNNASINNGGTIINVYDGANITHRNNSDGVAVYQPQNGTLNVYGGTMTGIVGIQICSGTVNISGGDITATGTNNLTNYTHTGDGNVVDGAALSIINRSGGYEGNINVNVTGGHFVSENGDAILEYTCNADCEKVESINISGGTFDGKTSDIKVELKSADVAVPVVTGGSFSKTEDAQTYFPTNSALTFDKNGKVVTDDATAVAKVNGVPYKTLQAAINAADPGDTVTLVNDVRIDSISMTLTDKDITIVGNGKTISLTPASGRTTKAFTLINSDLTLDGVKMTVTGTQNAAGNYDGTAFDVRNNGSSLNLINNSELTMTNLESAIIFADAVTSSYGEFNVTNSKVTASSIDGNASNGGAWTVEDSVLTFTNCGSHAFSVETADVTNSTITVDGAGLCAVYGKELNFGANTTVNVTNSGPATPTENWNETETYYGAVQIKELPGCSLTVESSAIINVSGTNNTVYLPAGAELVNNGTINATVNVPADSDMNVVLFMADGRQYDVQVVNDGDSVRMPTLSKSGYTFTGWRVNSSNTIVKGGESYPITANTTFTAVWNMIMIPDTYDIAVDQPAHGTVDVSFSNASQGSVITVTATPDEGYELVYITVDGEPISGNSFVMPDHAVEVSALFAEIGKEVNFVDVSRADWFYDYVQYVAQNGLMEGTTRTAFEPNASMTRAMFWTVLARIDGETITGDAWKTLAQTWAVESGISDGTNADALITREQMVTMLYRYAGSPVTGGMAISEFTDGSSVSDYAADAVTWALSEGILTGMGDGILAPQGTATRAQAAAMLMRFVEA